MQAASGSIAPVASRSMLGRWHGTFNEGKRNAAEQSQHPYNRPGGDYFQAYLPLSSFDIHAQSHCCKTVTRCTFVIFYIDIMRLNITGLVGFLLVSLSHATNGGWSSSAACPTIYTTIYSVATSYVTIESTVETTVYVSVTDTTTEIQVQPTTIVVTATTVESNFVTVPTTVVAPTTIVNQFTVTDTELETVTDTVSAIETATVTVTPLTGLVTCTSRIVNPTYTPPAPLPTNYLWGCPPGTICTPPQIGCNWEQNPPADTYVCAPSECKPLPGLPTITNFNALWPNPIEPDCAWYNPVLGYFHLNPEFFGLTFAIFDIYGQPVCPTTAPAKVTGWVDWTPPQSGHPPKIRRRWTKNPIAEIISRQSLAIAPAACYAVYDAASVVGQNTGLVYDQLCVSGTVFQDAVSACRQCAAANAATSTSTDDFPSLQMYETWCSSNGP